MFSAILLAYSSVAIASGSAPQSSKSNIPAQLSAKAAVLHVTFVDPVTGKLLWNATIAQSEGQSGAQGNFVGIMENVDAVLYQSGKAADALHAPTVTADNANKTVTATGGVRLTSLTSKDTTIICDKLIWYSAQNVVLGLGHVVLHRPGFNETAPSFIADTKLKEIKMPASGSSKLRLIHTIFQP